MLSRAAEGAKGPVVMPDLLCSKERADVTEEGIGGREACARQGEAVVPFLAAAGGRVVRRCQCRNSGNAGCQQGALDNYRSPCV